MDAQNAAAEAASTERSASSASPKVSSRPAPDAAWPKNSLSSSLARSTTLVRSSLSTSKEARGANPSSKSAAASKDSSTKGSGGASTLSGNATVKPSSASSRDRSDKSDGDSGGADANSDAETIVLSKDGSPSKPRNRKVIKHEDKDKDKDKRNGDAASASSSHAHQASTTASRKHAADRTGVGHAERVDRHDRPERADRVDRADRVEKSTGSSAGGDSLSAAALQQKRKRIQDRKQQLGQHPRIKDTSSSLSSVSISSPPLSRQHSANLSGSGSDSDFPAPRPTKSPKALPSAHADRLQPPEKLVPHKRKASKAESDDESETRKARRQRLAAASGEGSSRHSAKPGKDQQSSHASGSNTKSSSLPHSRSHPGESTSQTRLHSPQPRTHRRSLSTQLPSHSNGMSVKKKRIPAPLQSTDYNSDESSASGSPHIRSSKLRSLTTPAAPESAISPAKIGPHKKHLDAHGQTFLARACARGEYELAKQRLKERPEDLNVADFAGNTPLQIAALNGYGDIVKLLIEAGCNLDCVNHDKDTPLLDAVDNGHLDVVKLLLDAGVNPRKANVNGEEPLDRVGNNVDNAAEIRAALIEAKKKMGDRRHTSEDPHRHEHDDFRLPHGSESPPRKSPVPASQSNVSANVAPASAPSSAPATASASASTSAPSATAAAAAAASGRRAGTVRATKTSNHLLYMPMDDKTLRQAAGRGDEETVTRILQVRDVVDDAESMVAAARGGHDVVIQLLLALGNANPDPEAISSAPAEHATPMLAAIGQENLNVVRLLLYQSSFNPTRRFRGETYHEIARQRAGPNWKEEEELLKKAYDSYKKAHSKIKSPPRKDGESKRLARADQRDDGSSRTPKRKLPSPSQEKTKKLGSSTTVAAKRPSSGASATASREEKASKRQSSEQHVSGASHDREEKLSPKRSGASGTTAHSSGKTKREERNSATTGPDRDTPPPLLKQKSKKADVETVTVSSEGETTAKPRRKLVSGKELKDGKEREKGRVEREREQREREREKQRRSSLASKESKESSSPREPRNDETASEKVPRTSDKHRDRERDRARKLKKEDARESKESSTSGGSGNGDGSGKRHRLSETPSHPGSSDKDPGEAAPVKRRKLDAAESKSDGAATVGTAKERKPSKASVLPETLQSKPSASSGSRGSASQAASSSTSKPAQKRRDDEDRKGSVLLSKTSKHHETLSDRGGRKGSELSAVSDEAREEMIQVKLEDADTEMMDVDSVTADDEKQKKKKKPSAASAATAATAATVADAIESAAEPTKTKDEDDTVAERQKKEDNRRKDEEIQEKRRQQQEEDESRKGEEEAERKQEEEEAAAAALKRKEEEAKKKQEEEKKKKEEEEKKKKEEEEKERRRKEEEREKERKRKEAEEKERKRKEEEEKEKKRKEEEEKENKRKEEEEKETKRKEEEEKEKRRREAEEAERKRKAAAAAAEEVERKKREEEERLRQEQLEREAAAEAERKEQERVRAAAAAAEAEVKQRQKEEQERERLQAIAKLPPVLRWLSTYVKNISSKGEAYPARTARKFRHMQGVRYDCLKPSTTGLPEGRQQWILNAQVALLLGESDLSLSHYPKLLEARLPASMYAKRVLWRLEGDRFALTDRDLHELGQELPGYYGCDDPSSMSQIVAEKLRLLAWEQFSSMDLFFVKASDFMDIAAATPHLHNLRLSVAYLEVPELESQLNRYASPQKWKDDPGVDQYHGFAPGNKYYVNGQMVREKMPGLSEVSKTPFREIRVVRRGFTAVSPDDPDYAQLCKEHGITVATPASTAASSPQLAQMANGVGAGSSHSPRPGSTSASPSSAKASGSGLHAQPHPVVNGVNGSRGV